MTLPLPRLGYTILIVALCHTAVPARAQSLVDAARLARETRERHDPPTKVYTAADFPEDARRVRPREPSVPVVPGDRSRLDEALERERVLLELLREQAVAPPVAGDDDARTPKPVKVREQAPRGGIPLAWVYAGSYAPPRTRRGADTRSSRRRGRRLEQPDPEARDEDAPQDEPGARVEASRRVNRNAYEESSRPFAYIAPGIPAPGSRPSGARLSRRVGRR